MELNDWILALHLLSAFALIGALVLFWILIVTGWNTDTPADVLRVVPVGRVGSIVVAVGGIGTLVFGVWLAISLDAYQLWDGWVIAALVLWAIGGAAGGQTGKEYNKAPEHARELEAAGQTGPSADLLALNQTRRGLALHSLASLAYLLVLIDMIWKPGA